MASSLPLEGHSDTVNALCVWQDHLFSASDDRSIIMWDTAGNFQRKLQGHTKGVNCLCVYDDFLYSGSGDASIRAWDLSGNCVGTTQYEEKILCLCNFQGQLFVAAANKVYGYSPSGDAVVLDEHTDIVRCLTVWNNQLVSGSNDCSIKRWDENGQCVLRINGHKGYVLNLCVWGQNLVSISADGTAMIWNSWGDCLLIIQRHSFCVWSCCVINDMFYSGLDDNSIRVWDKDGNVTSCFTDGETRWSCMIDCNGRLFTGALTGLIIGWEGKQDDMRQNEQLQTIEQNEEQLNEPAPNTIEEEFENGWV